LIPWTLPDGINTTYKYLPKKLKEAGYTSHHIGKWHNGLSSSDILICVYHQCFWVLSTVQYPCSRRILVAVQANTSKDSLQCHYMY
jgi:hypothetical protein